MNRQVGSMTRTLCFDVSVPLFFIKDIDVSCMSVSLCMTYFKGALKDEREMFQLKNL